MGVPSFFKWLVDKYPWVLMKGGNVTQFDNLYIDMNGIVHTCCRFTEGNQYGIKEDEMFARIVTAVEYIFHLCSPRHVLHLALDGVAPRAKLNQQRARRYEAARHRRSILDDDTCSEEEGEMTVDELDAIKQSLDFGVFDTLQEKERSTPGHRGSAMVTQAHDDSIGLCGPSIWDDEEPSNQDACDSDQLGWDSNCITPGTGFMARLADHLRSFIVQKQSSESAWQQVAVIFSDSSVYGEGEHKIADFIRAQRCQSTYDPNTSHIICGSDADFIMLALALHEPHIFILRERHNRGLAGDPELTRYDVLSIGILRDYLLAEFKVKFSKVSDNLDGELDVERIIDDFVFLCFFVGNDFLPHLPSCFVDVFAIDNLLEVYRGMLPSLGGYITTEGLLDYRRVGKLAAQYAKLEDSQFIQEAKLQHAAGLLGDYRDWRTMYYESIGITEVAEKQRMVREYVRGWSWILRYYSSNTHRPAPGGPERKEHRKETASLWQWFYPFHYAPLTRDVADFLLTADDAALRDIHSYQDRSSTPFTPFCQLLAVLPPDSLNLLPPSYREAVEATGSPVRDFYPEHYQIDPNGRTQEWKAVILLPFIDGERLRALEAELAAGLGAEDQRRNTLRPAASLFVSSAHPLAAHTPALERAAFTPIASQSRVQGLISKPTEPAASLGASDCGGSVQHFAFLDPAVPPEAPTHSLLPGAAPGPSLFDEAPARGCPLTSHGQFYCCVVLVVFGTVVACEILQDSNLRSLADTLSRLGQVTSLAWLHLCLGLLISPQQSFWACARAPKKATALTRHRRLNFLRDCPPGAYQDWVCRKCLARNFSKNSDCHECAEKKGPTPLTVFTHRQPHAEASKIVIDHRRDLRRVRGWRTKPPAPHSFF